MRFDTKIAVIVRDDLEPLAGLNVTAFLASGIPRRTPTCSASPTPTPTAPRYLPLFGSRCWSSRATRRWCRAAHGRALRRGLPTAVFTADLFATGTTPTTAPRSPGRAGADLDLVGVAVHGQRNAVDKIVKGAALHR